MEQQILALTNAHATRCQNDLRHILQFTLNAAYKDMQAAVARNNAILQRELQNILSNGGNGGEDDDDGCGIDGDGDDNAASPFGNICDGGTDAALTMTSEQQHAANQLILNDQLPHQHQALKIPIIDTNGTIHSNKKKRSHSSTTTTSPPKDSLGRIKQPRTNHSKDDTLRLAVEEWFRIKDTAEGGAPTKRQFAISRGINPRTFGHYVCDNPLKRKVAGASMGKPSIVSAEHLEYLVQYVATNESSEEKMTLGQVAEKLLELNPEGMTEKQAKNWTHRTFKRIAEERLGIVFPGRNHAATRKRGHDTASMEEEEEEEEGAQKSLYGLASPSVPRVFDDGGAYS